MLAEVAGLVNQKTIEVGGPSRRVRKVLVCDGAAARERDSCGFGPSGGRPRASPPATACSTPTWIIDAGGARHEVHLRCLAANIRE